MQSVNDKVFARIRAKGRRSSFTNKDFLDLGSRGSVDMALTALAKEGRIRRVRRGLYDYPDFNAELGGRLGPDVDRVVQAWARRLGVRIQPAGAAAANMLGLSTQVPAHMIYLTDGRSRTLRVGGLTVRFKRTTPGRFQKGHGVTSLVATALRDLGPRGVDDAAIARLRGRLSEKHRNQLLKDAQHLEGWIYAIARKVAQPETVSR
ncbi:MAG: hypothetical protein KJ749_10250 [Planctomycetes bacterium]|nr:hypothetical protein [Planctomycetota bacterium]